MMYFNYDPIIGLIYHFCVGDIMLDLEIIPRHFDPKEVIDRYFQRGLILKDSFEENSHPIQMIGSVKSNLFDTEIPLPDNFPYLLDEAGRWQEPTYNTLEELALSFKCG